MKKIITYSVCSVIVLGMIAWFINYKLRYYPLNQTILVVTKRNNSSTDNILTMLDSNNHKATFAKRGAALTLGDYKDNGTPRVSLIEYVGNNNNPYHSLFLTYQNKKWVQSPDYRLDAATHKWVGENHLVIRVVDGLDQWVFIENDGQGEQQLPTALNYWPGHDGTYLIGETDSQLFRYDIATQTVTVIISADFTPSIRKRLSLHSDNLYIREQDQLLQINVKTLEQTPLATIPRAVQFSKELQLNLHMVS